ncbi:MAG: hypothetical protein SFU84_10815 [Gemmatimonadales bacterium]|nr:hypothetical protein [Gemmatimonadales bacterium]
MRRLGWLMVLAMLLPGGVTAQISPGPLAKAHQSLEGATKCSQCHGPSRDAMPRLCLNCHKEVTLLVSQGRGYHAREAKTSGKSCASCHPDHAGREFAMIAWPAGGRDRFDHRGAGWALEGKHAPLACAKCHIAEYRTDPAALISPRKGSAGWLGLETACSSCHKTDDPHRNSLGPKCETCHSAEGWSPAPKFDHATSRYPLTGAHEEVTCAKCHLAPTLRITPDAAGKRVPLYRPLEYAECASCHADPHKGRLSTKCSDCHVTKGFDVLDRRGFNHGLTRYPLLGKHRQVGCERCHGRDMATPRPASTTCSGCHADRHAGEATLAGAAVDCAGCHRVEGFAPATYTVAQHRSAKYALTGKHQAVRCASCHTATRSAPATVSVVHLRVPFATCATCHADPHGGQLAGNRCEQCHGDAGWKTLRYDLADHRQTTLPLEGRHATMACVDCHGARRTGLPALPATASLGTAAVLFHLSETRCVACHADPHVIPGQPRTSDSTATCADCHTAASFRPATVTVASHARYRLPLEGAHRAVPCRDCHTGLPASSPLPVRGATLVAAGKPMARVALGVPKGASCASCHEGPHGTQFATRADSGRCDACHSSDRFVGTLRFDHERQSSFSLKGAHATVACVACHRVESLNGKAQVRYRPLATSCESCHRTTTPGGRP